MSESTLTSEPVKALSSVTAPRPLLPPLARVMQTWVPSEVTAVGSWNW
jgi:hypothetical protein